MSTKVTICVMAIISAVMLVLVLVNVFGSASSDDDDSFGLISTTTESIAPSPGKFFLFSHRQHNSDTTLGTPMCLSLLCFTGFFQGIAYQRNGTSRTVSAAQTFGIFFPQIQNTSPAFILPPAEEEEVWKRYHWELCNRAQLSQAVKICGQWLRIPSLLKFTSVLITRFTGPTWTGVIKRPFWTLVSVSWLNISSNPSTCL